MRSCPHPCQKKKSPELGLWDCLFMWLFYLCPSYLRLCPFVQHGVHYKDWRHEAYSLLRWTCIAYEKKKTLSTFSFLSNPWLVLLLSTDELKDDFDSMVPDATLQPIGNGTGEFHVFLMSLQPHPHNPHPTRSPSTEFTWLLYVKNHMSHFYMNHFHMIHLLARY